MNLVQLRRLVGNSDAYAVQNPDGSWTPVREPLTDKVLHKHMAREITVGTYVGHLAEGGTVARTLVLDFDSGEAALEEAVAAEAALHDLGFTKGQVGIEFSGRKGYHVWLVLHEYRPNAELRRVGRAVLALADLPASTEVFPKQDEVRDLGNLVKLPGGVHRVTGQANDFLGNPPVPVPTPVWLRVLSGLPEEVRARSTEPVDNRFPCLSTIQCGVREGGRNIQLFHLATMFRRHGADEDLLWAILDHVNSIGDELDEAELRGIVESSAHSGPICEQLPQDMQDGCGQHCIKARLAGLTPRPGQLRNASIGEAVVVTVGAREDDKVTLTHDDIELMKGRIRGR